MISGFFSWAFPSIDLPEVVEDYQKQGCELRNMFWIGPAERAAFALVLDADGDVDAARAEFERQQRDPNLAQSYSLAWQIREHLGYWQANWPRVQIPQSPQSSAVLSG